MKRMSGNNREGVGAGAPPVRSQKQGSALVLTLLMLALMLTLVLYYVSLVRLETQVSGFTTSHRLSREALDLAIAEALSELEVRHRLRAAQEKVYLSETTHNEWVSAGQGGVLTNGVIQSDLERAGWPHPAEILSRVADARWVLSGDSNKIHSAYAWAVVPLTGMLDPEGLEGWNVAHLDVIDPFPHDQVYFSATEFMESHEGAKPFFQPGTYSRDRGWFDFSASPPSWQTNVVVDTETISMNPLNWSTTEVAAVFEERYPDRDFAGLAEAFQDFRDGRTLPTNPEGITTVPVPMFNEVTASMTLHTLEDDLVEIIHRLDLEIWYPFPGNINTSTYRVAVTPALESPDADLRLVPKESDDKWTFPEPAGDPVPEFAILTLTTSPYTVSRTVGQSLEVVWNLGGLEIEQLDTGPADRLPEGLTLPLSATVPSPGEPPITVTETREVKDPVLNHNPAMWVNADAPSLSSVNQAAVDAREAEELADGWARWTPAGRGGEWEEGWIGFFPLDTPWRSVDLFAEEGQWWLRHTRPKGWEPGEWVRNRVNPNSLLSESIAAVFVDLPKEEWPGMPNSETVLVEEAKLLAGFLAEDLYNDLASNQRGDWTDALEYTLMYGDADRHAAESVIAHSLDRMAVSYQLYGLIVWSETRFPGGGVRSRQREIVLLWLDPYPNPEGRHAVIKLLRSPF